MFVKTQFDTIVNVAEFDKIKIDWSVRQPSESICHVISVVSAEISYPHQQSADITDEVPVVTERSETLAQFPQDEANKAKYAYSELFNALLQGKTAFDMTVYVDE